MKYVNGLSRAIFVVFGILTVNQSFASLRPSANLPQMYQGSAASSQECKTLLKSLETEVSDSMAAYSQKYPEATSAIYDELGSDGRNSNLVTAILKVEKALLDQKYKLLKQKLDFNGSRSGFAGNTNFMTLTRTYLTSDGSQSVDMVVSFNFLGGKPKPLAYQVSRISVTDPILFVNSSKTPTLKSLKDLELIAENAQVGNGHADISVYDPQNFSLEKAEKQIAQARPNLKSEDRKRLLHSFKTGSGVEAALAILGGEDIKNVDPQMQIQIKDLHDKGLIQEIVFRKTDKVTEDSYLIPYVFDIYVRYVNAEGLTQGQRIRLHYEFGD